MSRVLTCQLHSHQAAIIPDQLTNTVPEQEDGVAKQLQNTMEHMWTLWETRGGEREQIFMTRTDSKVSGKETDEWEFAIFKQKRDETEEWSPVYIF